MRLSAEGLQVNLAASASEARLFLREPCCYDLALMDLNPGGKTSGSDLLLGFRQKPSYDTVPIMALTAYALPGDHERFLKAGFET